MATHVKIKTIENNHVHFDTHRNNYTLCGLETGGDPGLSIAEAVVTNRKVNCPECVQIVAFCKAIKSTEFKKY